MNTRSSRLRLVPRSPEPVPMNPDTITRAMVSALVDTMTDEEWDHVLDTGASHPAPNPDAWYSGLSDLGFLW